MGRSVQLEIDGLVLRLQHNQEEEKLLDLAKKASSRIQKMRQLAPGAAQQMCILTVLLQLLQEAEVAEQDLASTREILLRTQEENRFLRTQILTVEQAQTKADAVAADDVQVSLAQQDMVDLLAALKTEDAEISAPLTKIKEQNSTRSGQRSLGRNPLSERKKSALPPQFSLPGLPVESPSISSARSSVKSTSNSKRKIIFQVNGEGDSLFERQLNYWQVAAILG